MSSLRKRMWAGGWILAALTQFVPVPATADAISCAERGGSYRLLRASDGPLAISVRKSDLISWTTIEGKPRVRIDAGNGFRRTGASGHHAADGSSQNVRLSVRGKDAVVAVSCAIGASGQIALGAVSGAVGADSLTRATGDGVRANSRARFASRRNSVTSGQVFLSTSAMGSGRSLPADWNAWATVRANRYDGGIAGGAVDLVGGVDRMIAPGFLVGMLGGLGRTQVVDGGTGAAANAPIIGAYFGHEMNNSLILDGFLSVATPGYTISGGAFRANRMAAGLTLSGQVQRPGVRIEPFVLARGYREAQPGYLTGGGAAIAADNVASFIASAGVRVSMTGPDRPRKLVPFVRAMADFKRETSTSAGVDLLVSPRFSVGLGGQVGQGHLAVDLDFGRTRADTLEHALTMDYELKF